MFTSSLFDNVPASPWEGCWVNLYPQFFNEIALLLDDYIKVEGHIPSFESVFLKAQRGVRQLKCKLKRVEDSKGNNSKNCDTLALKQLKNICQGVMQFK
jgi:hypothetical protein